MLAHCNFFEQLTYRSSTDIIKFGFVDEIPSQVAPLTRTYTVVRFIPEFMGRVPTITTLTPLTISDLRRILSDVKGSIMAQYTALFDYEGIEIRFTQSAQDAICKLAFQRGGGARGLRGIVVRLAFYTREPWAAADTTRSIGESLAQSNV